MNNQEPQITSSALVADTPSFSPSEQSHPDLQSSPSAIRTNWSANYRYQAERFHTPTSLTELQDLVQRSKSLKVLGTRHSFNGIADTTGDQIALIHFNDITINASSQTVTVGAGVTYGHLAPYLHARGYALGNLASLPHISVAGACSTATHGSGSSNGTLATAVSALELVTGNGELLTISKANDPHRFPGAVVSLGALGVITKLTLDIQPTFNLSQTVYENLSFDHLEQHLPEIFASGYSVSLFTDWQNHRATQVWIKTRLPNKATSPALPNFFGAFPATRRMHPLPGHSAENCTEQLGIPGPWFERLPHFRMNFTPSSGAELQSEYFVPRDKAYASILALEQLREYITPLLFVCEFRTISSDMNWLSPCYGRESIAFHFTWKPDWPAVNKVLSLIEEKLQPFDARPHWAKLFTVAPERLQKKYPKLPAFQDLVNDLDSKGKFRNDYLDTFLFSGTRTS